MCQAKFNLPAYLGRDCGGNSLAEIEGWGQRKGTGAETVTGGLDLARRAENRGNLGRAIP